MISGVRHIASSSLPPSTAYSMAAVAVDLLVNGVSSAARRRREADRPHINLRLRATQTA